MKFQGQDVFWNMKSMEKLLVAATAFAAKKTTIAVCNRMEELVIHYVRSASICNTSNLWTMIWNIRRMKLDLNSMNVIALRCKGPIISVGSVFEFSQRTFSTKLT